MWKIIAILTIFADFSQQTLINYNDALCDRQLRHFRESLANPRQNWAVEMFDYWAKFQSGLTVGNTENLGHYDECLRVYHESGKSAVGNIQGQFCLVSFTAAETKNSTDWNENFDWREIGNFIRQSSLNLRSGICVPSSCSPKKTVEFVNEFLSIADLVASSARCDVKDQYSFSGLDIFAIVLLSLFAILLAGSTAYEIYAIKNSKTPCKILSTFSLFTNGQQLFDVQKIKSKASINSIHGIRALSILWVIMGHRRLVHLFFPLTNPAEVNKWLENIRTVIYQTDHLAVDTFFVMGGLLLVTSFMRDLDKKQVSLWRMYLRRYLRYTPLLAVIILYTVTLQKFLVQGPVFDAVEAARNCQTNWWAALLHIQNYLEWSRMCFNVSWYLSADFQLFLISPILIYAVWKLGYKLLWFFPLVSILTVIYLFLIAYFHELPVFYLRSSPENGEIFHRYIYFPTHARMGPWFIGMTTGFFIYRNRNQKAEISRTFFSISWIIALSTIFAVILGFHPFMQMTKNTTTILENAIYMATFRNAFACGVAWIIYGCNSGTGGIVRWFLSWPHWQPISRMGLSVYLIHTVYQTIIISGHKQPLHFSEISLLHAYFGDVVAVLFLGAAAYLTFEAPFANLGNLLAKKRKQIQN